MSDLGLKSLTLSTQYAADFARQLAGHLSDKTQDQIEDYAKRALLVANMDLEFCDVNGGWEKDEDAAKSLHESLREARAALAWMLYLRPGAPFEAEMKKEDGR